ncbi:bifunctional ADP-dependent (S)-NAD(P)H-hydrate dehydratase/NAD(P)H-hydrate epimerase [Ruegeria marisrubri]|uniref:Bifunctional NAD(P)H-hydrate repair enzyme n=1 Tax=Ruegeria marisrubri TaxID=1685379 RepID=A0A0X3TYK6_9RHOB|nr:bifunctional ADP-dependent NAD(P)H-hydrate dehydratase/NAD(P)H-hydrate epimerase [Ruegeria marisrubri]KUJ80722.1 bifunctional ADP-dependent (S)-NAD(P)H-hydrate dehydratase/NAD(P)H-hydrate epimerase [Ruegeria marisrubri]
MVELLTAAQMRAIEQAAIESDQASGLDLMEKAGRGIFEAIFEEWPELAREPQRAVVLCGPGNNGGDGFVVARLLREWGWGVDVFLYGNPEKLPPDAKVNHDRWKALGGAVQPIEAFQDAPAERPALALDALFGTGLTRGLDEVAAQAIGLLGLMRKWTPPVRVVAVDMPSGYCSDSGRRLFEEQTIKGADLTVTFERPRLGHRLDEAAIVSGKVVVKPLGIRHPEDGALLDSITPVAQECRVNPHWLAKRDDDHKYSHGHALILSGGSGKTGAARLAARGALRIGAGLVTLGVPPSAQMEVASQITALMLRRIDGADGLTEVLGDERLNAVCMGPGLGLERARELVPVVLGQGGVTPRPTVLDADALTAFADAPENLFGLLHEECVLTPHGGEFARLFPDVARKLAELPVKGPAYSKVDAAREAAERAGCTVLFKGPDTVIAAPDGRCFVNSAHHDRAAPWLATAGAGDVLAGFIAGLLARGLSAQVAAEMAAWLHVECAREFGSGLIAEDLPEQLPAVFKRLTI